MVSAADINCNVSPHYATSSDFLIAAVLGSPSSDKNSFGRLILQMRHKILNLI